MTWVLSIPGSSRNGPHRLLHLRLLLTYFSEWAAQQTDRTQNDGRRQKGLRSRVAGRTAIGPDASAAGIVSFTRAIPHRCFTLNNNKHNTTDFHRPLGSPSTMAMGVRRSRQVPDLKNHSSVVTFKLAILLAVAFSILVDLRRVDLRQWSRSLIIFDSRVFSLVQRRNFSLSQSRPSAKVDSKILYLYIL